MKLVSLCSLYVPNIIKFYKCIQLLQAKMKVSPFNLARRVQQRDPLGSLEFCEAIHPLIMSLNSFIGLANLSEWTLRTKFYAAIVIPNTITSDAIILWVSVQNNASEQIFFGVLPPLVTFWGYITRKWGQQNLSNKFNLLGKKGSWGGGITLLPSYRVVETSCSFLFISTIEWTS